jgi:hypothetical protein
MVPDRSSAAPAKCRRLRYFGRQVASYDAVRDAKAEAHALNVSEANAAAEAALDWLRAAVAIRAIVLKATRAAQQAVR